MKVVEERRTADKVRRCLTGWQAKMVLIVRFSSDAFHHSSLYQLLLVMQINVAYRTKTSGKAPGLFC